MAKEQRKVYAIQEDVVLTGIKNPREFDPQKIGEAIEAIRIRDGGEFKPERGVQAARDPKHPFHKHLEWNDFKAAEAYRIDQMRAIVRVVRVEFQEEFHRAFLSLPSDKGGRSYVTLSDVINNQGLRDALAQQAESELASWQQRYRELREICELVQPALAALSKRRKAKGEVRPSA